MDMYYKIVKGHAKDGRKNYWVNEVFYWLNERHNEFYILNDIKNDIYVYKAPPKTWDNCFMYFAVHIKQNKNGGLLYDETKFDKELVEYIINNDNWQIGYHPLIEEAL